jgi:hypothetical protein
MEYFNFIAPFFKNLGVLYLTVFFVFLVSAVIKNGGLTGFSLKFWMHDNQERFKAGAVVIFLLSLLMAVTDASPLFNWIGLDINASPVALGLALAVLLGLAPTKQRRITPKAKKAKEIQAKGEEVVQKAVEIQQEEAVKVKRAAKPRVKKEKK